jgi:hypothetical protein
VSPEGATEAPPGVVVVPSPEEPAGGMQTGTVWFVPSLEVTPIHWTSAA